MAHEGFAARTFVVFNPGSHPAPKWIAASLAAEHKLTRYWTSGQIRSDEVGTRAFRLLPVRVRAELKNRTLPPALLASFVGRAGTLRDLVATAVKRKGWINLERRIMYSRNRAIARRAVRHWRRHDRTSWFFFPTNTHSGISRLCVKNNIPFLLYTPLPFAPVAEAMMDAEANSNPEWAQFLQFRNEDKLASDPDALFEASHASGVVANSEFTARSFDGIVDAGNVHSVPLSINLRRFEESGLRLAATRTTRGLDEPLRIIYAGQVTQRKGLSYLFEALQDLHGVAKIELTIVGPDPLGMAIPLQQRFPDVDVRFAGSLAQEKLWKEMAASHLFVFPTLLDGFGNVLAEALAVGLPVLSTDRCGILDLGAVPRAALLADAGDSEALRIHLRNLYLDEGARIVLSAGTSDLDFGGGDWATYGHRVAELLSNSKTGS
ncbi:glycosyltransferase family 4 protein [Herbiconiux solani]|uniref:glycosyltransferase family 4 protein n=1 Tax=Herbiconiux solani TaxID=661329 RepID=UPI0012ECEFC2|nr:glycosyltransferase family 4 protein [Herbiconiux solani]